MNSLIDLLLAGLTVLLKGTDHTDDAVKFLSVGLEGWKVSKDLSAETKAATAMLHHMQTDKVQPSREMKDAEYARIMAAIASVKPS